MMATERWGQLHLQLSTKARDGVASPSLDGSDLTRVDRDALLNLAWQSYISLIHNYYTEEYFDLVVRNIQEAIGYSTAVFSTGSVYGRLALPSDALSPLKILLSGSNVKLELPTAFFEIASGAIPHKAPSTMNIYVSHIGNELYVAPNIASSDGVIIYIKRALPVFYSSTTGTDIPVLENHFPTIIDLAMSELYAQRKDYQASALQYEKALRSSWLSQLIPSKK